jgi:hypothetical protein
MRSRIPLLPFALSSLFALAGSALGPSRAAAADVVINEFSRTLAGTGMIELYNTRADTAFDLSGWTLVNGQGTVLVLSGILGPNEYKDFPSSLVLEGGQIELYDGTLLKRDEVAYGDEGGAPLPPPLGGFSCARAPDGADSGDDAADFNLDASSTFAAPNDNPPAGLGFTDVRINEAGRDPFAAARGGGCPVPPVLELHNVGPAPVDLSGWWFTDGRAVRVLDGFLPPNGFFLESVFPPAFCFEATGVLYLFAPGGQRVDQVGIRGATLPGNQASYQKVPDGAPPFDGFDYLTSGGSSTWVIKPNTFGQSNGEGPVTPVGEIQTRSWAGTKAGYR